MELLAAFITLWAFVFMIIAMVTGSLLYGGITVAMVVAAGACLRRRRRSNADMLKDFFDEWAE